MYGHYHLSVADLYHYEARMGDLSNLYFRSLEDVFTIVLDVVKVFLPLISE